MTKTVVSVRKHPAWGIRSKVLSLMSLSVLLPTVLVGTSAYWTAREILTNRLTGQLNASASLAASEITEWFAERQHDARVFAGASVIVTNLERGRREPVEAYLTEVSQRQPQGTGLGLIGSNGRLLAGVGVVTEASLSELVLDPAAESASLGFRGEEARLWVTSPVRGDQGLVLGFFVVSWSFDSLRDSISEDGMLGRIRIVDDRGRMVITHPESAAVGDPIPYDLSDTGQIAELRSPEGERMLAVARPIPVRGQSLVLLVETDRRVAFAAVDELRARIITYSLLMAALVITLAYFLVVSITRPLDTLTDGADAVSRGDYTVELPVRTRDEVGYLTEVFNRMTAALRKTHETLERLSTTDELTKLVNRRELRRTLSEALARAEERKSPLSLILIDIDHFKALNDEQGHLRGDELLERIGSYLTSVLRNTDVAARYGGEEFLLVLPDTEVDEAAATAETIRSGFSENDSGSGRVTLSMGVAAWPQDGSSEAELIEAADRALYRAKRQGRNRVVVAKSAAKKPSKAAKKKGDKTAAVH